MTHEQRAKKFLEELYLKAFGYLDEDARDEIDNFYKHLSKAIQQDVRRN
jgi:hypothetical protein